MDDTKFKQDIENLIDTMISKTDFETAKIQYAEKLCAAVKDYITSAQINYTSGLTAPNGAVTGTFNGNLS